MRDKLALLSARLQEEQSIVSRNRPHMRVKTSSRRWLGDMTDIADQR
jgi:hypothetical protein